MDVILINGYSQAWERQKAFFLSRGMELKQVKTLHMPALFHSSEMPQVG